MSKTLFWYVMRDLLRVFLMTSVVLAGIMSFGGLLKPLMQYGLSGGQVAKMLMYFMPATQTWSLPIAALFATTVVYGRLAADNELTACRAHGISYLTMALPAFWLGIILACVSFACLSFVVPRFTLRAEKVAFQSLADVVQKNIQRSHQLKLEGFVIYAEDAEILPPDPRWPGDESVRLTGPMFCTYETRIDQDRTRLSVPDEFYTARFATVVIHQAEDHVEFTARLEDGMTFPRKFEGAPAEIGGLGTGQFRSMQLRSPIKENTKFMDLRQLRNFHQNPAETTEIRELYLAITAQEQETAFLNTVANTLKTRKLCEFSDPQSGDGYVLELEPGVRSLPRGKSKLLFTSGETPGTRYIRLIRTRNGQQTTTDEARNLSVAVHSDLETKRMQVEFQLGDVSVTGDEGRPAISSVHRPLSVPMTADLLTIESRGPEFYMHKGATRGGDENRSKLHRKLLGLRNGIESEIHSRASFAISCLILVMVGCALGMMFKTGNYLSAFALSVVPALVTICLMITGQHVSENSVANSLSLGLGLIWAGNVIVFGIAMGLLDYLRRQ